MKRVFCIVIWVFGPSLSASALCGQGVANQTQGNGRDSLNQFANQYLNIVTMPTFKGAIAKASNGCWVARTHFISIVS